jgi:hypothetical protein
MDSANAGVSRDVLPRRLLSELYTLSYTERFYFVTSYLKEKLSKLRNFDRK